jgi:hypothetical protein
MEPKQLDDTKTQSMVDLTTIYCGSKLMALYTAYPESFAPGNYLTDTYWQIDGNIQFIYGTVEEAKEMIEKTANLDSMGPWIYDSINDRYYFTTTTAKYPFGKEKVTRFIIAFVKNKTIINLEESF